MPDVEKRLSAVALTYEAEDGAPRVVAKGQRWLVMIDINVKEFAKANKLSPELQARIQKVRDGLDEIIRAGSKGDL